MWIIFHRLDTKNNWGGAYVFGMLIDESKGKYEEIDISILEYCFYCLFYCTIHINEKNHIVVHAKRMVMVWIGLNFGSVMNSTIDNIMVHFFLQRHDFRTEKEFPVRRG